MWMTVRVVISALLRRHPPEEALQACVDRELDGLALEVTRAHLQACEHCSRDVQNSLAVLDLFVLTDVEAEHLAELRASLNAALDASQQDRVAAVRQIRRLLGDRAARRLEAGAIGPEFQREVAAFLGGRAAASLLRRISV